MCIRDRPSNDFQQDEKCWGCRKFKGSKAGCHMCCPWKAAGYVARKEQQKKEQAAQKELEQQKKEPAAQEEPAKQEELAKQEEQA